MLPDETIHCSLSFTVSSYLHDLGRHDLSLNRSIGYCITRDLDQIYLSGARLKEEQRLLRIQQEATD